MISSKKSGVISGWQLDPNGDILYSETLPSDTIISELVVLYMRAIAIGCVFQTYFMYEKPCHGGARYACMHIYNVMSMCECVF